MIERRRFLDVIVKSAGYCSLLFSGWFASGRDRLGLPLSDASDRKFRLEFVLHYPEKVGPEQAMKDAEEIFPNRKADSISSKFVSKNMIFEKDCSYQSDRMVYSVIFTSRREYMEWENELKSHKAYNKRLMKQLGYKITTHRNYV